MRPLLHEGEALETTGTPALFSDTPCLPFSCSGRRGQVPLVHEMEAATLPL